MSNGADVIATSLPLKNLQFMSVGSFNAIIIKACLICSSFYVCNNILVLSCGYTYHQFCAGLHLKSKATHCGTLLVGSPYLMIGLLVLVFNKRAYCWRGLNKRRDVVLSTPQGVYKAQFNYNFFLLDLVGRKLVTLGSNVGSHVIKWFYLCYLVVCWLLASWFGLLGLILMFTFSN